MEDRDIDFEHRLTEVEQRAKSNTIKPGSGLKMEPLPRRKVIL